MADIPVGEVEASFDICFFLGKSQDKVRSKKHARDQTETTQPPRHMMHHDPPGGWKQHVSDA